MAVNAPPPPPPRVRGRSPRTRGGGGALTITYIMQPITLSIYNCPCLSVRTHAQKPRQKVKGHYHNKSPELLTAKLESHSRCRVRHWTLERDRCTTTVRFSLSVSSFFPFFFPFHFFLFSPSVSPPPPPPPQFFPLSPLIPFPP